MPRDIEITLCSVLTGRQQSDEALIEWLDTFRRSLDLRLSQLHGTLPPIRSTIYRSEATATAEATTAESADVIILVIAPGCFGAADLEIRARRFLESHSGGDELVRVIASPVAADAVPGWLADVPEFDLTREQGKSYWARLEDLALHIVSLIDRPSRPVADSPAGFAVYLADSPQGLEREREMIRRAIDRAGIGLLQTNGRSRTEVELEDRVRGAIARSAISVHLLDSLAPQAIANGAANLLSLELAEAYGRCRSDESFQQLIWLPPSGDLAMAQQEETLLQSYGETAGEIDLLRISIEDFKSRIGDAIQRAREQPPEDQAVAGAEGRPMVYLMVDSRDVDDTGQLRDYLGSEGLEVILPALDGDSVGMRQHHQQSLRICDAAMIYYGRVHEPWVRMKQQDILKSAGFARSKPMSGSAVLMGPEPTAEKLRFSADSITIIRCVEGFRPESLRPFLEAIRQNQL